jgi:hypothetical protein
MALYDMHVEAHERLSIGDIFERSVSKTCVNGLPLALQKLSRVFETLYPIRILVPTPACDPDFSQAVVNPPPTHENRYERESPAQSQKQPKCGIE